MKENQNSNTKTPTKTPKPIGVMCHICGREYGSRSLDIHVKQCKKKWDVQESQKPPGDRRPCPSTPKKTTEFN